MNKELNMIFQLMAFLNVDVNVWVTGKEMIVMNVLSIVLMVLLNQNIVQELQNQTMEIVLVIVQNIMKILKVVIFVFLHLMIVFVKYLEHQFEQLQILVIVHVQETGQEEFVMNVLLLVINITNLILFFANVNQFVEMVILFQEKKTAKEFVEEQTKFVHHQTFVMIILVLMELALKLQ